jgi:hypothetical protein
MPEIRTEPAVAVELEFPRSLLARLDALAESKGKDRVGILADLVETTQPATRAAVLAPVHEEYRRSGMDEVELDELLEAELKAHREGG